MSDFNIEESFSRATISRAKLIVFGNQATLEPHPRPDERGYIEGQVQGTARSPYKVIVYLDDDELYTVCTCPVMGQCKHGAAVFMLWQSSQHAEKIENDSKNLPLRMQQLAKQVGHDRDVMAWVSNLVNALEPASEPSRPASPQSTEIIYELSSVITNSGPTLGVRVLKAGLLASGHFGKGRLHDLEDYYGLYDSEIKESDAVILDLLGTCVDRYGYIFNHKAKGTVGLNSQMGAYLLSQMLHTGRLFWGDEREVAIGIGPAKEANIVWNSTGGKAALVQMSTNLHEAGNVFISNTTPMWYVDPYRMMAGVIDSEHSAALLMAASESPQLPAKAAQALSNVLVSQAKNAAIPLPAEPSIVFVDQPLVCRIKVYSADGSPRVDQWTVKILMCYAEHEFHVDLQPASDVSSLTLPDGTETEVLRDHSSEYRQYQFFRRRVSGFEPVYAKNPAVFSIADHQPLARTDEERYRSFDRLFDAFDSLSAEGFDITVEAPVSLTAETVSDFDFDLQPVDNAWFDLGLQLNHEGNQYNLLPLVLNWLAEGDPESPLMLTAIDGRRLSVPPEMVRPVADTLLELYDDSSEQVKVSRARAVSLSRLSEEVDRAGGTSQWLGDETLIALAKKIESISQDQQTLLKKAKAPRTLKAELRPYQLTGMAWMSFLHDAGLCGVLADDMGLGKTIQTLAYILSLKQRRKLAGPCLIVAPTSVVHNWAREAQRFAPILRTRVWHGAERHDEPLADSDAMLVVTSYALALRDEVVLAGHGFAIMVLDEAQTIKNPSAKITQCLKRMPIQQRFCLTGTPLENHLGELWSLFDFLMPGMLGPQKRFSQHFRTPIEKHGDSDRQRRLNNAIGPFLLRRRKQSVAAELPPKTEVIRNIKLEGDQARLYETIRVGMEKRVRKLLQEKGVAKSHIQMLDALLKLRQSCCHPQLVKLDSAAKVKTSAKTDYVLAMIEELVAEGRKIILFSQFTQMLDILEREIAQRKIGYVKLTGKTRKRQEAVDAFQNGSVPLFLISLKAGGTGLNLTAADTVIHYDPWWNPAVENQATDRAHRIGQNKAVFVYKLIADNTVEDKIVAMQARKQALADATVDSGDANPVKSLSAEDILSLFAED